MEFPVRVQHLSRQHEPRVFQMYTPALRDLFRIFREHRSILGRVIHQKNPHQYRALIREMDLENAQKVIHNEVGQYR